MNRSALLVIDLQAAAFDAEVIPALHKADELLRRAAELIQAAHAAGTPVVFSQHCDPEGGSLAKGTAGWAIHPSLSPQPSDSVVLKRESSAFAGTRLEELLEQKGIDTVIICGIQSEHCVANTCVSALELGLNVYIAQDAHSTRPTESDRASTIIDRQNSSLMELGANVQPSASLVELLGAS